MMKGIKETIPKALMLFAIFTVVCGILYTGIVTIDLVTCSGSGLDPHISPAAAEYQAARIAKARGMTEEAVGEIIDRCTEGRFLGAFGEGTVNVLKVNLMLDGILEE